MTSPERVRTSRMFWAVTEQYTVRWVTGYDCLPDNPRHWWVPELGGTMGEGYALFETRHEAVAAARASLRQEIERLVTALELLEAEHDR